MRTPVSHHRGVSFRGVTLAILIALALIASACGDDSPTTLTPTTLPAAPASPWPAPFGDSHQTWTVRIIERIPHDATAFTQGLELHGSLLLESTGRPDRSALATLDPRTGTVSAVIALDRDHFGEGLTVAGDEIIQLTYEAGLALRYDASTLDPIGAFRYEGEGWGICDGDAGLWMSNGTTQLTRRDPESFAVLDVVTVQRDGQAIDGINELECIDDLVVANVWKSDALLVIDPRSGTVVATVDAAALVDEIGATDDQAVLNGIADLGDGTLLLAGKLWPTFFVVEVVTG